ncbi:MAG: DUF169 domain-containing protein [candidate division Zixibacteria bacterium]|nr:DUF169 domain-containing protein [candidate division Zixibacteria bacterium]NIR65089.1 DUF169 domain-containing protein [candidate division Zixibacteria bacterium]NIS18240.1 DUF169 domain-containing protein [candidate division Zixibacteria bacterium]NIS49271.1 DUF169 domain-containing protein [candidate division Zixibacteria bacterium]NIT54530.1 DUF169 domain-containing protein [candidate division Zixibacteria bacterium]
MQCKLADILRLKHNPVAIIFTNEKPAEAMQFRKGKWGCVMMLFAQAARGKTAVFDRETYGCFGGGTGLGFGNQYYSFSGGIECFYSFLSSGNIETVEGEDLAKESGEFRRRESYKDFMHGEGYVKSPELVKKFVDNLPIIDVPAKYVMFKSLKDVDEKKEEPQVIVFTVNPDQLSALVVLANYERASFDNVYAPFAAGCQAIGILAYKEREKDNPRAVIGLTDLSARKYSTRQLGKDALTFAIPLKMFYEMEGNIEGSFLERETWKKLVKMNMEEE